MNRLSKLQTIRVTHLHNKVILREHTKKACHLISSGRDRRYIQRDF